MPKIVDLIDVAFDETADDVAEIAREYETSEEETEL